MHRRPGRFNGAVDIRARNGYVERDVCHWSLLLSIVRPKSFASTLYRPLLLALIPAALILLPSCGVVDFVSAYFNTYYNARRLFNDAETEVMTQLDTRPGGRNWLLTFGIQAGTRTKLESVIEKCSKLLQYHPESSLVDDALMMIGKAYYYEDDNQQAMRKFNEIISGYPDGARAMEARLLLSYAQYRMGARDEARKTAEMTADLARKNDDGDILSRVSLLLGQLSLEDRDYVKAENCFEEAAKSGSTPEQRTSAWLMSASMYQKMEKYPEAEHAYLAAAKASNNYIGEYRGSFGAYRMAEKQGRTDEALKGYHLLRADAKYKEFFGELELEIANTYRDMGDLPMAVNRYTYVDTAFPRSETSARSYFALGDLYEHTLFMYDSALSAYAKGKTEFPMAEVSPISARRADYLTKYYSYQREIVKYDSVRAAILSKIDTGRAGGSLKSEGELLRGGTVADTVRGRVARDTVRGGLAADTVRSRLAVDTVRSRSGVDIARGLMAEQPTRSRLAVDSARSRVGIDSVRPPLDPRMVILDSANVRLETATNEMAGLFYATIGLPDSAETWYRFVLQDFPEGRYAARALYTLAQIYAVRDSVANKPLTDSLYRQILNRFPRSEFAPEARRLLGLPPVETAVDAADSTYDGAEALLFKGDSAAAVERFKSIASAYPSSPLAPRALYAAGYIYENGMMNRDSAVATYARLTSRYPASFYATRVAPKMFEVTQARQRAAADSAAARRLAQMRADSAAARRAAADSANVKRQAHQPGGVGNPVMRAPGEAPKAPLTTAAADSLSRKVSTDSLGRKISADSLGRNVSADSTARKAAADSVEAKKIPKRVPGKEGKIPE